MRVISQLGEVLSYVFVHAKPAGIHRYNYTLITHVLVNNVRKDTITIVSRIKISRHSYLFMLNTLILYKTQL